MLKMTVLERRYSIYRLDPGITVPSWALEGDFFSVTRTEGEVSVVCLEGSAPTDVMKEDGWRLLKVEGPLDFSLTGILSGIAGCLAQAGVSIFAMSTFDTDYILVRQDALASAIEALRLGHYDVTDTTAD